MKKIFGLMIFMIGAVICSNTVMAQVKSGGTYNFPFLANMHTMTGTDTTFVLEVKGNSDYSVQIIASGVDSTTANVKLMGSNSSVLADFVEIGDTTYTLTKTTRHSRIWTGTYFPYTYIGIKYTQGNCDHAVISAVMIMKKHDE